MNAYKEEKEWDLMDFIQKWQGLLDAIEVMMAKKEGAGWMCQAPGARSSCESSACSCELFSANSEK